MDFDNMLIYIADYKKLQYFRNQMSVQFINEVVNTQNSSKNNHCFKELC